MQIRYPGVILTSLAMALHAALVGRYLESVFFIVAFCWAWVAVTALRDRLQSAQSMVLTMMGLLLCLVLPIAIARLSSTTLAAHLSLAIVPGIVSWACMFIYIRHVRQQDENDTEGNMSGIALSITEMAAARFDELLPPLQAVEPQLPITLPKPDAANDQPPAAPGPQEELTVERVAEIVETLRTISVTRTAA